MVKVKKLHTKKFYKQLKSHLKSPGAKKTICENKSETLFQQVNFKVSPLRACHRKLKRKAGDKSHGPDDLFFEPAISQTQLIKEKVKLCRMITASVVAKNDHVSVNCDASPEILDVEKSFSIHKSEPVSNEDFKGESSPKRPTPCKPSESKLELPSSEHASKKVHHLKAWLNSCSEVAAEHSEPKNETHGDRQEHSSLYLDRSSDSDSSSLQDCEKRTVNVSPMHNTGKPFEDRTSMATVDVSTPQQHGSLHHTSGYHSSQTRSLSKNADSGLLNHHDNNSLSAPATIRLPSYSWHGNDDLDNLPTQRHQVDVVDEKDEDDLLGFKPFEQRWEEFLVKVSQESSHDAQSRNKEPSKEFEIVPLTPTQPPTSNTSKQTEPILWSDSSGSDIKEEIGQMADLIKESRKARSPAKYYGLNPNAPLDEAESSNPPPPPHPKNRSWESSSDDEVETRFACFESSDADSTGLSPLKQYYVTIGNNHSFMTSQGSNESSPFRENFCV